MEALPVDHRDIEIGWDATTYRVYFWSGDGGHCTEFELTGVDDLQQVIAWAQENADGRVPEIFVRRDHGAEPGLIRLAGGRPGVK